VALGEIAAACKSPAADEAIAALQARKSGKAATLERLLAAGTHVHLESDNMTTSCCQAVGPTSVAVRQHAVDCHKPTA
jgi:hypothetical protein